MRIDRISSWRDLDDALGDRTWSRGSRRVHPATVFRGLSHASYRNVHSLARLHADFVELEPHLLRSFRNYASRSTPGPTVWDWLSLAQHHGLPTRLLDWTHSPLVALHFATVTATEDDGILWEVDCEGVHEHLPAPLREALARSGARFFTTPLLQTHARSLEELDALAEGEPFVLFFEPPSVNERIVNQAAVLSVAADARTQVEDWLADHPGLWRAWRIDPDVKAEIRRRLDQGNITERVLLGGLDGLAAWLRRYYSPQEPEAASQNGGTMRERPQTRVGGGSMDDG